MFSKTCTFLYFYILSHLFSFWTFSPPLPLVHLFFSVPSLHPNFHKPYPQFGTFLNIGAVPRSAAFCSNTVPITIPSSSSQFFSFFDVLPSAPTATGMTLMFLVFLILLISLFSSWYLSIFG